jgi:nitroimidazol reductase NimA-like FMN-containing flavoprotein (pyridoxamine 5'-phosphate oxidase superfamily)
MNITDRSKVRRLPARGSHELEVIHAILDEGFLAHIGFQVDGQPFVIPTNYGRDGERLFLHGSAASRMMRELEKGVPVCVTVTHIDGLVLARSAFHHSMNYRSVVAFGTARKVANENKDHALRVISDHLIRGRWNDVRGPNEQELKATTVLEFTIEEASAKVRTGGPVDDEEDHSLNVWAGVLPLAITPGTPLPDAQIHPEATLPSYIGDYRPKTRTLRSAE